MYVRANPVRYTDPTGHFACGDGIDDPRCEQYDPPTIPSTLKPKSPTTLDEPTLSSPNDAITTSIIVIDGVSFVISGVEAVLADIVGGGIIVVGCGATGLETAGLGCGAFAGMALKVDMAIASYGSPIGSVENLLGIASTSLTWYSDQDNIWTPDSSYISVGKDTVISIRNTVLGQVPESNIDALISFSQLKYDLERLEGIDPSGRVVIIGNGGVNPSLGDDLLNFLLYDW
jgi:hypothetical protein